MKKLPTTRAFSTLPAAGGLGPSIDDEMKDTNKLDEPEVDDEDHLSNASNRGESI
jgi:hypothetical protein